MIALIGYQANPDQEAADGYTLVIEDGKQKVSNSQRYKMLGNGWTVDVITHILKNMEL